MIILILEFIKDYGTQLSAIGAMIAFIFVVYKYQIERKTTLFWKEFEAFHKLIKELVEPESGTQTMKLDRQIAVLFELRNYKRYYPVSLRILEGLKASWETKEANERLVNEIKLTIIHIENTLCIWKKIYSKMLLLLSWVFCKSSSKMR